MPELIYNETCRDASLRAIVTYKRGCTDCCVCSKMKAMKQLKPRRKSKFLHRKKKHNKCCSKDTSCPQRIDQIALPLNRRIQGTLQRFGHYFDTERVLKVCRLIHELQNPQPQLPSLLKTKRKKKKCLKAKACCKSGKLKAEWLNKQTSKSCDRMIRYLICLRRMIPNYKQLQVTMMLYKSLNFRKLKPCNRFVKEELKIICQKLAILIDVKLQPYKQEFVVDQISCTTLEDKHCVFKMFKYVPPESEEETEIIYEEEASVWEEGSLYAGEEPELSELETVEEEEGIGEEEALAAEAAEEEEEAEEEEAGEFGEEGFGPEGLSEGMILSEEEGEEEVPGELEHFEELVERELAEIASQKVFGPMIAELAVEEEEFIEEEESIQLAAEEAKITKFEEEEASIFEAPSEVSEISEPSLPDTHPDGTSSYVDWCLYVSWLKELGRNIEMYANCLQEFKAAIQDDRASKFTETIKFILKNWSNYLAESREVDKNMTTYFKDKPMSWCSMCRDCTIDNYPTEHYIPPELDDVIKTTKHWRRLLAEAEEYCNLLSKEAGKEEGGMEEVEEMYEIFDVGTSSSSSFDIMEVGASGRRSRSR